MVSATEERKRGGPGGLRVGLGVLGAGMAVVAGQAIGGALFRALSLPAPLPPEGTDVAGLARVMPVAAGVLALGLAPLAIGLRAPAWLRVVVLTSLVLLVWGVAAALGAQPTVTAGAEGIPHPGLVLASALLPSLGAGAALALLGGGGELPARRRLPAASHAGRVGILLVLFPVVYLGFGWLAYEVLGMVYPEGSLGLTQPTWAALLPTLGARSLLLALAVVAVVRLWGQDAAHLPMALGTALFVLLGGYHLILGYGFPGGARLVHGAGILAGALFYASAAAILLCVPPLSGTAPRAQAWEG